MQRKEIVAIGIVAVAALTLIALGLSELQPERPSSKMPVVASFFPLYDFARQVGGDKVEVSILVSSGAEVHDWEPTVEAIRQAASAKVTLYNGANLEPWADSLKNSVGAFNITHVDTSDGLSLLPLEEGGNDPHIWLDPQNAKHQVTKISEAFVNVDPANKEYYEANANMYMAKLDALDAEIRDSLRTCARTEFISFHEAFSYFAKRYGLTQLYLLSSGEEEPSPEDVIRVIQAAQEKGITIVYSEPLQDPRLAEEVARHIPGGRVLSLSPLEEIPQEDIEAGEDYLSIMRENLRNLLEGLECSQ
ncbi:MAG: zinc ABC transporter substrate-binding protein [Thaumarchaeota archaeon]|nr:zinc ABC transporter substrate-binding protein [Nitrososphaerota archaeon]